MARSADRRVRAFPTNVLSPVAGSRGHGYPRSVSSCGLQPWERRRNRGVTSSALLARQRRPHEAPAGASGIVLCRRIAPCRSIPAAVAHSIFQRLCSSRIGARLVAGASVAALAAVGCRWLDQSGQPHDRPFASRSATTHGRIGGHRHSSRQFGRNT